MSRQESVKKSFTFLWKLQNISFCLEGKGERIESPTFITNEICNAKWRLWLYPRGEKDGNYIGLFLHREKDCESLDKIEIKYEIALIANDESVLKSSYLGNCIIRKDEIGYGKSKFEKREVVFISRRSEFIPNDTLTVRCRIWKSAGEMTQDVRCTAYTRIGVQRASFLWSVKNFSPLELEGKRTYQVKSTENGASVMTIDLSLGGVFGSGEIIRFKLSLLDETIKFATLQLHLINASGNRIECNKDEFYFDSSNKCEKFTFMFSKEKLLAKKSLYLPNDVLSLYWEWAFSRGIVFQETVDMQYGSVSSKNEVSNSNIEEKLPLSPALNNNLESLYDHQFLCDVKLKTSIATFPAHKIILSASSSVFKAMFTNDMKEKYSDHVDIEDLTDDVVRRMLLFVYTGRVDLTWENTSQLYVAADKYDIQSLKKICSSYLKDNLSPSNACEVLLLSDFHSDGDLKSTVQNYILKHIKDIVNSEEWELLVDENGKLAAETVCLQYK